MENVAQSASEAPLFYSTLSLTMIQCRWATNEHARRELGGMSFYASGEWDFVLTDLSE